MPISSLDDLRQHLQWAIELEHSTLPPYLCALYSIKPGTNREATGVITSVFLEEMLHMTLAANLLNAVGGTPAIDGPGFVPTYPSYLPHSNNRFLVPLAAFSPATLETFMQIEKPQASGATPEDHRYETIGQFYQAIENALPVLCESLGESQVFCGDPARQITPVMLDYPGGGRIVPVYDLQSALNAINEIEEQGEGLKHDEVWDGDRDMFHPEREEVAHYFRFVEITKGRAFQRGDTPSSGPTGGPFEVDWSAVFPMRENPRTDDFPLGDPVRAKMDAFNQLYADVLHTLQRGFNGEPQRLFASVVAMMEMKQRAQELMQMPTGDGRTTAGPSFEPVPRVPAPRSHTKAGMRISVREHGPYVVEGGVPLSRKSIVYSELHEPLTWRKDATLDVDGTYRLCRCGQSSHKPYCDNTHRRVGFDGTETATPAPNPDRHKRLAGTAITMTDDSELCTHAGFCGNRVEKVWGMLPRTADTRVRFQLMQMVERCPSGRLAYELADGPLEPDLPTGISVTKDGPYWVTGAISITMADGRQIDTRNRVTLCRCGQSSNKPLCDGSHTSRKFTDG